MYYITNQQPGEPDMLTPLKDNKLVIKTLEGTVIYSQDAPEKGWTHELLAEVQPQGMEYGAEAYLDNVWIGSTEV
ncbi:hypothetical protein [Pantoea septica]|uniref:hypothetical protein n=1 Tax=Pantoea septica TaxID=472695 RepID=UPI0025ED4BE1|nr:hypothetical protein [Pantoea septica]